MKNIIMSILLLFGVVTLFGQTITVRSDRAADVDFAGFKTFDWADQVDNQLDSGYYFLNDLILKAQVREAVRNEMMGLGYELTDNAPDLIVNFRVFDKPAVLKNLSDYGDDYWGRTSYSNISEATNYEVEAGTLLLSLVDRKSGRLVWNGFASGLIENDQFIKDEGKVIEAVNMIFDEYNQRAREYSRK
jgi:hypothetical protein